MNVPPSNATVFARQARAASTALGLYALLGCLLTLIGWLGEWPRLTDWDGDGISMFPNTAVCGLAVTMGLLFFRADLQRTVLPLGVFAALVGAATLFEHVADIELGIDTILVYRTWGQRAAAAPLRMGPPASCSFMLLGLSLMLLTGRRGGLAQRLSGSFAHIVSLIALLSILGYAYGADALYAIPHLTGIALQTATIVLALSLALLLALPEQEPTRTLLSESSAGLLARRALPLVVLIPMTLGWLCVQGEALGWYAGGIGMAFLVLALVVLLCGVLWWGVATVRQHEQELAASLESAMRAVAERERAEKALERINAELEQRVVQRTAEAETRAAQLSALAAELAETEQRERLRMAQVLHDGLQQTLVAAQLHLGANSLSSDGSGNQNIARVDSLLDAALRQSRNLVMELSPPLLHDAGLGPALEWLAHQCQEQHGLQVHLDIDAAAEPADASLREFLFQAARELLFNVRKHSKTDEASVSLQVADDGSLQLDVRDDGVGCDVGTITTLRGKHFGLFSVRERIRILGGDVKISSVPGQGMCVRLSVPMGGSVPVHGSDDTPAASDHSNGSIHADNKARIRVLIADDHPLVREGLMLTLQRHPRIEVVGQACDGEEAVSLVSELRPDVVLMDVSMPRLNGVEATRRIKGAVPDTRVIGLSMYESRDMESAMLRAGASAFLCKANATAELVTAILQEQSNAEA